MVESYFPVEIEAMVEENKKLKTARRHGWTTGRLEGIQSPTGIMKP